MLLQNSVVWNVDQANSNREHYCGYTASEIPLLGQEYNIKAFDLVSISSRYQTSAYTPISLIGPFS